MRDAALEALAEYERTVAPAYEVIRRSRARLMARLVEAMGDPIPAHPTEPDGAELRVEAFIHHPELGLLSGGSPDAPDAPAPESPPVSAGEAAPSVAASGEAEARAASPNSDAGVRVTDPLAPATARAASSPPGGSSVPAPDQPGSARVGQRERRERGRRAPARSAAPLASSSDPVGTPTPASPLVECPDCGREVKAMGIGTHRRQAHGRGRPTVLVKPPQPCRCSCGRTFSLAAGLGRHRSVSGHPAVAPWKPDPVVGEPAAVLKNGREHWLCSRCPQEFLDREARDEHAATHPPDDPGGVTVGRDPFAQRPLGASGVQIA